MRVKVATRHTASTSTGWHSAFALCCNSNETRATIGNPPDSAQLEGTPYHSSKLHPGQSSSLGMRRGAGRHTDTDMRDHYYTFRVVYDSREM